MVISARSDVAGSMVSDADVLSSISIYDDVPLSSPTSTLTLSSTRLPDIRSAFFKPTSRLFVACHQPLEEVDDIVALDLPSLRY